MDRRFDDVRGTPLLIGRRPNVRDLAKPNPVNKSRAWGVGAIVVFLLLCAGIAISQWYAVHVNVPHYQALLDKQKH
jgi:hypothetical protein